MNDPFKVGEVVVGVTQYMWQLTIGKEYTILEVIPEYRTPTFTFPPYVVVEGDAGRRITCHTHRFKRKEAP